MRVRHRGARIQRRGAGIAKFFFGVLTAIALIQLHGTSLESSTFPEANTPEIPLSTLVENSTVIVRGEITSAAGAHFKERQEPFVLREGVYTRVKLRVTESIKGIVPDSLLTIETEGGTVEAYRKVIIGGCTFPTEVGLELFVLLRPTTATDAGCPRELSMSLTPTQAWRVHKRVVGAGGSILFVDELAQYLKQLVAGQDLTLDSFLTSVRRPDAVTPESPTIPPRVLQRQKPQ